MFGSITNEELRSGANRLGLYMFIVVSSGDSTLVISLPVPDSRHV